tara:strand:+ start:1445 stop:1759 length:315 start_codon:yes stop_codon:yes gene_type:complete
MLKQIKFDIGENNMVAKTKAKKTAEAPKTEEAPAQAQQQAPAGIGDLSIGDLRNIATVIDVASTRGAFRANEMAGVGTIYNKLQTFLARVAPAESTDQKTEEKK